MERRVFIIGGVAGAIGLVEYTLVSRWMNGMHITPAVPSVKAFEPYGERAALMAITPTDDFYVTSKGSTPMLRAENWRLKIDGLVEHPLTLTYSDVLALPPIDRELTLECIGNPIGGSTFGNARWTGTRLKPLIERVVPKPEARNVAIYGADGLSTGHPIERVWSEENFLAYQMNGQDLPPDHGYPMRVFIPGKFGMKQPKWLTRIQFVNKAYVGYWETIGWSDSCER